MTGDPVVSLEGVTFRYPGSGTDVLRDVDLTIERGDFAAIVGSNGSGKSTLCKTFTGMVPHYWSGALSGRIVVDGIDTRDASVATLSRNVGYVYQDFGNQLVRPTVRDEVAFAPVNYGLDDYANRAAEALDVLGIGGLADKFVWQLSGGQQHLVALAGVLALRPSVIVVDEPVAELDPARATQIYERLAGLNRTDGTTIVVIEHHTEFVAQYCRSVVLMGEGRVRWHRPVREALLRTEELAEDGIPPPQVVTAAGGLSDTGEPLPITLDDAVPWFGVRADVSGNDWIGNPHVDSRSSRDSWTREAGDSGQNVHAMRADRSKGRESEGGARFTKSRSRLSPSVGEAIARLRGVTFGYRTVTGFDTVLDELDLEFRDGDRVALVGGNGAGKSSVMRLLTGVRRPGGGAVTVCGRNAAKTRPELLADQVAYLYQRPEQMFLHDSVRADVEMFPRGRRRPDVDELVAEVLDRVRLREVAERDGRLLSGGQQRRATLGIGLAMRPSLLLLDEPTSSLDVATRRDVTAMLDALSETIRCVVVATHDMQLVAEWAERVVVLHGGKVVADTHPRVLFADRALLDLAGLVPPQVTELGRRLGVTPVPLSVGELVAALRPAGVAA